MSIAQPYLLFLGDVIDPLAAKTGVIRAPASAKAHTIGRQNDRRGHVLNIGNSTSINVYVRLLQNVL